MFIYPNVANRGNLSPLIPRGLGTNLFAEGKKGDAEEKKKAWLSHLTRINISISGSLQ